jgi:hypothetical protein
VDISGPNLVYNNFTQILEATKPKILFNFSHGCHTYLIGSDMRCSLTRGWEDQTSCGVCGMPSNLGAIKDIGIVAMSCDSAYQLGRCAVNYGAPFYIGFQDKLIIVSDAYGSQNIYRDALLPIAKNLLIGWEVGAVVEKTKDDLYKPVELLSVTLYYDLTYFTAHGNLKWRM